MGSRALVLGVRGGLAILFGIFALIWPKITIVAIIYLFAAYAIVNGLVVVFGAFKEGAAKGWMLFAGILSVLAGIMVAVWPGITTLILLWCIGGWFIVTGIFEIIGGFMLRKQVEGEWMMILSGVLSLIFGLLLIIWPGAGAVSLLWLIAVFAIILGIALVVRAFQEKKSARTA